MFLTPPAQAAALFNDPQLLQSIIVLLALGLLVVISHQFLRWPRPKRPPQANKFRFRPVLVASTPPPPPISNPSAQIDAIAMVGFQTTPLLNREEARLLPILEAALKDFAPGHRLMAQTSLGELIRPCAPSKTTDQAKLDAAYASINSKRLDFAVINRTGHLVAAIEYQGSGHFQNTAVLRDAVKREALRKAGVPFIEVFPQHSAEHIRSHLRAALAPGQTGFASENPGPKPVS